MSEQPRPAPGSGTAPGTAPGAAFGTAFPASAPPGANPELAALGETWWQAVQSFVVLLEGLDEAQWRRPTGLSGWDVHAVAAHVAHLESLRAGTPHDDVEIGDPEHVRNAMGRFTEQGVAARRDRTPAELLAEIRTATAALRRLQFAEPPTDPDAPAPGAFGLIGWSTRTLLRNRPLDVAMHELDVRRAVGRPGNLEHPSVVHCADYLSESLGYVLAKRVQAPLGTTVRLDVTGHPARAWQVGEDGRGHALSPVPERADVRLACDRETFLLLAGGRVHGAAATATRARVQVEGDADLAAQILARMAVTP